MTVGVHFDGVSLSYGDRHVLRDISLDLTEKRVGIVGANGSGKSSLLRLINGLVAPTEGQVRVGELPVDRHIGAVRRMVGFLFSDPDLQIIMPTVQEDLAFSLRRRGLSKQQIARRVAAVLGEFGLADHADHPCQFLSGGQKQLLALAAILITEPTIVVADEPTTLLDLRNSRMVLERLQEIPQQLILVTHDLDVVRDFDRVVALDEGRVIADGDPATVVKRYAQLMA